jgi:hypothetical protein
MKKLGKLSLSELKTGMSQISEEEANGLKGGTVQINGSTWYTLLEYHDLALAGQWNGWNHVLGLKGTVGPFNAQTNSNGSLTYDNEELSPNEALQLYYGGLGVRGSNGNTYSNYVSGGVASNYGTGYSGYGNSGDPLEPSIFHMDLGSSTVGSFIVYDDIHNNTQTLMDRFNLAKNTVESQYTSAQLQGMTFEFDGLNLFVYKNLSGSASGTFIEEVKGEIVPV